MYPCTYEDCGISFKKKWRLVEHLVKHTGIKPFVCNEDGCDKSFGRQSHLQRHMKHHLPTKDYQCLEEGCHGKFVSREALSHHVKRVHTEKPFKCSWPSCGAGFKKHQQLKVHAYQHDGTARHVCDHDGCGKVFPFPSRLKAHKKTHQGYTCDVPGCELVVYKWTDLRKHKHSAHRNSFSCDKCEKAFDTRSKLKNHSKVHDEEREVFECPYEDCLRSYTRVSYLKQHVSNYHEGVRPYACPHDGCVKTFANKRSMIKHNVVHEPGYCKPPSNPKRKWTLASRLSGFPDEATYNFGRKKLDHKGEPANRKEAKKERVSDKRADSRDTEAVTNECESSDGQRSGKPKEVFPENTRDLSQSVDERVGDHETTEATTEKNHCHSYGKNDLNIQRNGQTSQKTSSSTLPIVEDQAERRQLGNASQGPGNNESNPYMTMCVSERDDEESSINVKPTKLSECMEGNALINGEGSVDRCALPEDCERKDGLPAEKSQSQFLNIQHNNNGYCRAPLQTVTSSKHDQDFDRFHEVTEIKAVLNLSSIKSCHTDRLNM